MEIKNGKKNQVFIMEKCLGSGFSSVKEMWKE
jgi:hypothetical protein